jgi:hypothetical protein
MVQKGIGGKVRGGVNLFILRYGWRKIVGRISHIACKRFAKLPEGLIFDYHAHEHPKSG